MVLYLVRLLIIVIIIIIIMMIVIIQIFYFYLQFSILILRGILRDLIHCCLKISLLIFYLHFEKIAYLI